MEPLAAQEVQGKNNGEQPQKDDDEGIQQSAVLEVQVVEVANGGNDSSSPTNTSSRNSRNGTPRENSRRFRKQTSEMTEKQKREANLGIILVCISVLFILCQSVKIVPDVSKIVSSHVTKCPSY